MKQTIIKNNKTLQRINKIKKSSIYTYVFLRVREIFQTITKSKNKWTSELYKNVFKKDVKLTFNIGLKLKKDVRDWLLEY